MAKQKTAVELIDSIASQLEELKNLVGGAEAPAEEAATEEAAPSVDLPDPKTLASIKETPSAKILEIGASLNIDSKDPKTVRATLVLASRFANGEELKNDELSKLAAGLGLDVSKKAATNKENIANYLSAGEPAEEAQPDAPEEAEGEAAPAEEAEATEGEAEPAEGEAEPAEGETETAEGEEPPAEEVTEEGTEDTGPDDKTIAAAILVYNKYAKAKLKPKDLAGMREKLTDDTGVVHQMGEPYTKDANAWSSGFQLADVPGKDYAKDVTTGKCYRYNAEEQLVEVKFKPVAKK